jgi:hypothetical protein
MSFLECPVPGMIPALRFSAGMHHRKFGVHFRDGCRTGNSSRCNGFIVAGEKDPAIARRLEHASSTTGIDDAFAALQKEKVLTYGDVLRTHETLFEAMHPWAGHDRTKSRLRANGYRRAIAATGPPPGGP